MLTQINTEHIMQNARAIAATIHGMSRSRPYRIWRGLRSRCDNPDKRHARWYSDISYHPSWRMFENFWADMGDTYADGLTLDRIDSTKDYYKDNCRWVTMHQQSRNRKDTIFLPHNGEMVCVTDFAAAHNVKRAILYQRIKRGVPLDQILLPSRKKTKGKL